MVEEHMARAPRHRAPLPAITIGDYLAAVAARKPRCRAPVGDAAAQLTYAELALDVERVACGLLALKVEKGDRIAIWAPDSTEWTLVQLAAARAGAVLVILDGDWGADQLLATLAGARPMLIFTAASERVALLASVRSELADPGRLVTIDGPACGGPDDLTWGELLLAGSAVHPARLGQREATLRPGDAVSIEYELLAGGGLRATTLTHRDYLAATGE
jgi:fatty-acyl-CoA synthase